MSVAEVVLIFGGVAVVLLAVVILTPEGPGCPRCGRPAGSTSRVNSGRTYYHCHLCVTTWAGDRT